MNPRSYDIGIRLDKTKIPMLLIQIPLTTKLQQEKCWYRFEKYVLNFWKSENIALLLFMLWHVAFSVVYKAFFSNKINNICFKLGPLRGCSRTYVLWMSSDAVTALPFIILLMCRSIVYRSRIFYLIVIFFIQLLPILSDYQRIFTVRYLLISEFK